MPMSPPHPQLPIDPSLSQPEKLTWAKIFLNVSLACIAYTRRLIPWQASCFRTRYVDQIIGATACAPFDSYEFFCAHDSQHAHMSQELRVLVRGGHEYADSILDILVTIIGSPLDRSGLTTSGKRSFRCVAAWSPSEPRLVAHHKHRRSSYH